MAEKRRENAKNIARVRAKTVQTKLQSSRPRSSVGCPVSYSLLCNKALAKKRVSRSLSDPVIPGNLVIYDKKGLFQTNKKPGGKVMMDSEQTRSCDPTNRPTLFDPSLLNKKEGVGELRSQFEAVTSLEVSTQSAVSEFLNPLHRENRTEVTYSQISKVEEQVTCIQTQDNVCAKSLKPLPKASSMDECYYGGIPRNPVKPLPKASSMDECYYGGTPRKPVKPLPKASSMDECYDGGIPRKPVKPLPKASSMDECYDGGIPRKPVKPLPKASSMDECYDGGIPRNPVKPLPKASSMDECYDGGIPRKPVKPLPRLPMRQRGKSDPSLVDANTSYQVFSTIEDGEEEGQKKQGQVEETCKDLSEDQEWSNGDCSLDSDSEWDSDFDGISDEDGNADLPHSSQEVSPAIDPPMPFPDAISRKLYNIALEILTTERTYVRRLHLLDQVFLCRLNNECCTKGIIPREVLMVVFSNIQPIHQLHRDFLLPKLEERMKQWTTISRIGDILKELAPFLKLYTDYISNFDKANETLSIWTKKALRMAEIISEIQKTRESENLTLGHHMLEPIQRIPRYKLLLTDYLSKLPSDSPDVKDCKDALEIISKAAQHANESMKSTERFKKILEMQEKIGESFDLITASRDFIKEGDLIKLSARKAETHQERRLMLFNDVLLCCVKFPGGTKYKVKVTMDLYGMEIGAVDEDVNLSNAFRITSKQRVIDFAASSPGEKEAWVESLQKAIKELMQKRDSYKIARKVAIMDEGDLGRKAPAWIRDDEASMCMLCDVVFTAWRRRHHCRACGQVVCNRCSSYKLALEYDENRQNRVCVNCYNVLIKGTEESSIEEEEAQNLLKISRESQIWMRGYLNYKGVNDKGWVKRWFVLSSNFVLYSHKAKKDTKAEFSFPLPGYSVDKPTLADYVDRKNVIKLHHKNVRVYFFEAKDEDTLKKWMRLLSFAVKAEQVQEDKPQESSRDSVEEENQSGSHSLPLRAAYSVSSPT